jgi:hypothetical protein
LQAVAAPTKLPKKEKQIIDGKKQQYGHKNKENDAG